MTAAPTTAPDGGREPRSGDVAGAGLTDPASTIEIVDRPPTDDVRSGADLVRLVLSLAIALIGTVLLIFTTGGVRSSQAELAQLIDSLPSTLRTAMAGTAQLIAFLVPLAAAVALLLSHRAKVVGEAILAAIIAVPIALLITSIAGDTSPTAIDRASSSTAWLSDAGFPGNVYLGGVVAVTTVIGPWLGRRWRQATWAAIIAVVALRIASEASGPVELLTTAAVGATVGSALLLIFGAPDRAPSAADVAAAVVGAGVPLRRLAYARTDREGVHAYTAESDDGRLYVTVTSDDDRRRDLIFKLYRYVRLRSIADEEVFRSTRSSVEHAAFLALWAHEAGVAAPRPVAVVPVGTRAMALVEEQVDGEALPAVERPPKPQPTDPMATAPAWVPNQLDDAVVTAIWQQAALLHRAGVAHRDLQARSIRVREADADHAASAAFVRFGVAELSASDQLLGIDLAQLLCEVALRVGIDRCVEAARAALPADRLALALPFLQPAALTKDTNTALRHQKTLVKDLRSAVAAATGAEEAKLEKLQRITIKQVLIVGFIGFAVYLLLPMVASLPEVWEALQDAEWGWIVATLPLVGLMYVGSALNFMGAVPDRLPFVQTYELQLASACLNRVTPKNVGGMALRLRYLTLRGMEPSPAAASVGLTSLGGTVSTTLLLIVFFLWAGQSGELSFSMPSISTVLLAVVVVGTILGGVLLTPWGRRVLIDKGWRYLRQALTSVSGVLRRPGKVAMLIGGSAFNTLCTIVALSFTLRAFGTPLPFPQVGVVFLGANLVASAAPTPGGVGVVEAGLIFGLTGFGVPNAEATSAALVFRMMTYWFVTLPGWLCLSLLRRRQVV